LVGNALPQHDADRAVKPSGFFQGDRGRRAQRVQAGAEQRLVYVDVSQPCYEPLIEENVLELTVAATKSVVKYGRRETAAKGFETEATVEVDKSTAIDQQDSTELSLIAEPKVSSVVEHDG